MAYVRNRQSADALRIMAGIVYSASFSYGLFHLVERYHAYSTLFFGWYVLFNVYRWFFRLPATGAGGTGSNPVYGFRL